MNALRTKAQLASKWSIGSTQSIGSGGPLRFGDLRVETNEDHHVFEVEILLNDLGKNAVRVEALCGRNQRRRSRTAGNEVGATASWCIVRLRLSRDGTRCTSSGRLHGASDAAL